MNGAMGQTYRLLPVITALFATTLLISNTLDTKIFTAFGLDLPAGIILFPLAYIFGDILTEVYGYAVARRTIWTGFVCLVLMLLSYEIARVLPSAAFWEKQEAFDAILGQIPRIVLASILAYLCGEFVNSAIVAKMKVAQAGRHMGTRFVISTLGGQAVDTAVFVLVAFLGVMSPSALLTVFVSGWAVKTAWEIIALPITLPVVRYIKRIENEDVYDRTTNFNPFRLSTREVEAHGNIQE